MMVHFDHSKKKTLSLADRMTDHLVAMRRGRDAKIQTKLDNGYRPRLDDNGNVILVKVKTKGGK